MISAQESRDLHKKWALELELADDEFKKWRERADKVVKRYRDDREKTSSKSQFNILWSNVQTLTPAIYSKLPKPEASRRYNDEDPIGRTAAVILERCLEYEVETYTDFGVALKNSLQDRLLSGRGTSWVRYEPHMLPVESPQVSDDVHEDDGNEPELEEEIDYECAPCDYVFWRDFRHSPARTWEEVRWVARDVYMTRDELVKRFGKLGESIPLAYMPDKLKDDKKELKEVSSKGEELEKALVVEIWSKTDSKVYWCCPDFDQILDARPDPLQLEEFFPCPKPLYATITTDSLIPVPDYCQYQDQAAELDRITARIESLERACKVAGVYDSSSKGLKELLSENVENRLIPVDSWAMFAEKGGINGAIAFLPLGEIVQALTVLYESREKCKQVIYEITGLADIVRGSTQASETATAQEIKSRFASIRIQQDQAEMARFASDLLKKKAEIMCRHFQPETLIKMSGVENTKDAEYALEAIQLLKSGDMRSFRVEVNADSMVELDVQQEKQERVEFLQAIGQYLTAALPIAQGAPQMTPFLLELLNFGVRGFRAGRDIEAAFDQLKSKMGEQQQMPPEAQQAIAQAQEQSQMAQESMAQTEQERQQLAEDKRNLDVEKQKMALEKEFSRAMEQLKKQAESQQAAQQKDVEAFKQKGLQDVASGIGQHMQVLDKFAAQVGDALAQMAETVAQIREEQAGEIQAVSEAVQQTQALLMKYATAKRTPVRGASGRVEGVRIEGFEPETIQ